MTNDVESVCTSETASPRPVVLIFVFYYLPGGKSGGPVRSIENLVNQLGDEFDFKIVTSDRDWNDTEPYKNIAVNHWKQVGKAKVFYLAEKNNSFLHIVKLLTETHYDVLYLNSYFNPKFTQILLWARKLGLAPKKPLIIAPRGEFSPGAFAIKLWKKSSYTWLTKRIGLYKDVTWHASTKYEAAEIKFHLRLNDSSNMSIVTASDIASVTASDIASDVASDVEVNADSVKPLLVLFISRITPKKNLDFALRVLAEVKFPVRFNIYGPVVEDSYWQYCSRLMKHLPDNVTAEYMGVLEHDKVMNVFRSHDLLFFPTRGENYGHVIMESLLAGTPVLIANTTPWLNLEAASVGWDLPLDNMTEFVNKIHLVTQLSIKSRNEWRKQVFSFALARSTDPAILASNRRLFLNALERMCSK